MQFIHRDDRPYPCTICGKRFTQKAHLIIHKRTHTGEKPYACHICHKRFAQTSHLAVHKRVHTGEKPFFCNFCGMGFCRRPRLEAHILQHMAKEAGGQRTSPASADVMASNRGNINLNLNQESLDAAAQLMELKMKGGSLVSGAGGGSVKSEPMESDENRMRDARRLSQQGNNTTMMMCDLSPYNNNNINKGVIDITGEESKQDQAIIMKKAWENKNTSGEVVSNELGKLTAGLTELTNVQQQQVLNNSLIMPSAANPSNLMLSPTHASSYHHAATAMVGGNPSLTMSGLVRTNSRVSLIDFTAEDILQHLLSRDDIKSCEFCCLVFKDPAMYYLHRSMHDKMDIRCCNLCGKLLKDKYDFTAHFLNQHK